MFWHQFYDLYVFTINYLPYTMSCILYSFGHSEVGSPSQMGSPTRGTWYLGFRNRACTRQAKNASKHHQRRSSLCSVCWPPHSCLAPMFGIHLLGIIYIYIYIVIWDIVRAFRSGVPIPNGVPNPRYLVPRIQKSGVYSTREKLWIQDPPSSASFVVVFRVLATLFMFGIHVWHPFAWHYIYIYIYSYMGYRGGGIATFMGTPFTRTPLLNALISKYRNKSLILTS